jgi:predicted nuclease of predicted toxin-antitoxin system
VLKRAATESRILVTIDTDFGELVFHKGYSHCGLVRLPNVPARKRITLMDTVLSRYGNHLEAGAVVTVRGDRIRVTTAA